MAGDGKKDKWISRMGAGSWAALGVLVILCLLLFRLNRENGDVKTEKEIRMERVLKKLSGAGETYVMINEENGSVTGALIVCEGAEDISVRLRVQDAARAILQVDNQKIHVAPMEEDKK